MLHQVATAEQIADWSIENIQADMDCEVCYTAITDSKNKNIELLISIALDSGDEEVVNPFYKAYVIDRITDHEFFEVYCTERDDRNQLINLLDSIISNTIPIEEQARMNDELKLYNQYLKEWKEDHDEGEPVCFDEFRNNEMQELVKYKLMTLPELADYIMTQEMNSDICFGLRYDEEHPKDEPECWYAVRKMELFDNKFLVGGMFGFGNVHACDINYHPSEDKAEIIRCIKDIIDTGWADPEEEDLKVSVEIKPNNK